MHDVGDTVRVPLSVTDANGTPTDATVAVVVTRPDGTMVPGLTVEHPAVGSYYVDVVTTEPGPWVWTWTASGAVPANVYTGQFWVRVPGPRLVGLTEIKRHLNKSITDTTDDDELLDWIDAARYVMEGIVGPIIPTSYTETHHAARSRVIRLRRRPVISVETVTVSYGGGDTYTLAAETTPPADRQYTVTPSGLLMNRSNGWTLTWPGDVTITYTAGRRVPADNIRMAVREFITHAWRQSQIASGGTRPRQDGPDAISLSYGLPNRVRELLVGQKKAPRLG